MLVTYSRFDRPCWYWNVVYRLLRRQFHSLLYGNTIQTLLNHITHFGPTAISDTSYMYLT